MKEENQPYIGTILEESISTIENHGMRQRDKRPISIWLVLLFAASLVAASMYGLTISLYPFLREATGIDDWLFIAKKFYHPLITLPLSCAIIYTIFKRKAYGWPLAFIIPIYLCIYTTYTLLPNLISSAPKTYPKGDEDRYWGDVIVCVVFTSLLMYWIFVLLKSKTKKYYQK